MKRAIASLGNALINRGFIMNEKAEKLYKIPFRETVFGYIKVLANSKEEALRLVDDGEYNDQEDIAILSIGEDFELLHGYVEEPD